MDSFIEKRVADIVAGGVAHAADLPLLEPFRPKPYTKEESLRLDLAFAKGKKEWADQEAARALAMEIDRRNTELKLVARYN